MNEPVPIDDAIYEARAAFVAELASRLHAYGTTAQRLEGAVAGVARRLGLYCEVFSNPTGIILSFADPVRGQYDGITRVLRLDPGEQNLARLAATDAIAEDVLAGRLAPKDGQAALLALDAPAPRRQAVLSALAFGLSAAAVAALLGAGGVDIATAGGIGVLIGVFAVLSSGRPQLIEAQEAIAALVATLLAAAVATFVAPLSLKTVVVSSLIVLMPGLMLTNAVSELASRQLVSGTARFAGAMMILLQLTFGTVAATQIVRLLGWQPQDAPTVLPSLPAEVGALLVASFAFAVLFRAARRDVLLVMGSALFGYAVTRRRRVAGDVDRRLRRRRLPRRHGRGRGQQPLRPAREPARRARARAGDHPAGARQREFPQPRLRDGARRLPRARHGVRRGLDARGDRRRPAVRQPAGAVAPEPLTDQRDQTMSMPSEPATAPRSMAVKPGLAPASSSRPTVCSQTK